PFFARGDETGVPDRNLGWPDADRVTHGVRNRRRRRHGRDLADADAAAGHMVETAFVEMHIDERRVADARDTVILHSPGQDVASRRIDLARLVKRVTDALNHRARRLAAGKRGYRDLADRNAGRNVEHAHMTEPGVDLDLDH